MLFFTSNTVVKTVIVDLFPGKVNNEMGHNSEAYLGFGVLGNGITGGRGVSQQFLR